MGPGTWSSCSGLRGGLSEYIEEVTEHDSEATEELAVRSDGLGIDSASVPMPEIALWLIDLPSVGEKKMGIRDVVCMAAKECLVDETEFIVRPE